MNETTRERPYSTVRDAFAAGDILCAAELEARAARRDGYDLTADLLDALAVSVSELEAERETLRERVEQAEVDTERKVTVEMRERVETLLGMLKANGIYPELVCSCGHMHISGEDDEDAGCRVCVCVEWAPGPLSHPAERT